MSNENKVTLTCTVHYRDPDKETTFIELESEDGSERMQIQSTRTWRELSDWLYQAGEFPFLPKPAPEAPHVANAEHHEMRLHMAKLLGMKRAGEKP